MADWAETLLGGAPKLVARCVVRRGDWCPTELSWGSAAGTMTASTAKLRAVATVGGSAQDSWLLATNNGFWRRWATRRDPVLHRLMDERGVDELETRMVLECNVWLPPGGNVKWTREVPVTFRRVPAGRNSVLSMNVPDPVAAVSSGLTAKAVLAPPVPFLPRIFDVVVDVGVGGVTWGIAGLPEMRIGDKVYKVQAVALESSSAAGGDTSRWRFRTPNDGRRRGERGDEIHLWRPPRGQ